MRILLSFIILVYLTTIFSCKKDSFINSADATISVSADSIKFDTVFTTTGSVTQSFKIFNNNEQKLKISAIKLMGAPTSAYSLNIDGIASNQVNNIEMEAKDSLYVFVTVRIDPNTNQLPFLIRDSISILYNGNQKFVQLQSYGQNAHFMNDAIIRGNQIWTNDLPYVITGNFRIDTTASLQINAGTKIYVRANSPFLVDGKLVINGTFNQPVIFRGDRLDEYYRDIPGGWQGIRFRNTSMDNVLTFTTFKNAYQAIRVESPSLNSNPKLILHQCIIDNAFDIGLYTMNSSVQADNTLISNCTYNIKAEGGGNYSFTHCTFATYTTAYLYHTKPGISISDTYILNGSALSNDLNADFINCIIWGDNYSLESEMEIIKEGNTIYNVTMDHSLLKAQTDPVNTVFISSIRNEDPLFDSIDAYNKYFDFRTNNNPASPVINSGTITLYTNDLDNNNRNIILPDMGSYEKQ